MYPPLVTCKFLPHTHYQGSVHQPWGTPGCWPLPGDHSCQSFLLHPHPPTLSPSTPWPFNTMIHWLHKPSILEKKLTFPYLYMIFNFDETNNHINPVLIFGRMLNNCTTSAATRLAYVCLIPLFVLPGQSWQPAPLINTWGINKQGWQVLHCCRYIANAR